MKRTWLATSPASNGVTHVAGVNIDTIGPSLFTMNAERLAAALLLRVRPNGQQVVETLVTVNGSGQARATKPIDLSTGDKLYLELYGTGFRGKTASQAVVARIGGVGTPVLFAGAQGQFEGLDQINVGPLLRSSRERRGGYLAHDSGSDFERGAGGVSVGGRVRRPPETGSRHAGYCARLACETRTDIAAHGRVAEWSKAVIFLKAPVN